jgi:protein tyrosine kinase modulator
MQLSELTQNRGNAMTAGDALDFLRRRRWLCIGTFTAIFLASVVLAFKLPPVYRSEATILIEQPTIPGDIVESTIRSYVDEQIQVVSQRVMTKENIQELVEKYDLYPELRATEPIEVVAASFRDNFDLQNQTAEVFDPRRGRMSGSTFAFVVAFQNDDPVTTQRVAENLAALYLAENTRSRREQASETTTFLVQEADRLGQEIAKTEKALAEYKDRHANALPEQKMLNMQTLDRRERELMETGRELINQRSERDQRATELSTISPYATLLSDAGQPIASADDRLALLRQDYLELSGRYGPEHPDVLRVRREIESLSQGGSVASTDDIDTRIAALTAQRSALLDSYSPEHPDVVRLERSIATLVEERSRASTSRSTAQFRIPNNPDYVRVQRQIAALDENIRAAGSRRIQLRAEIDELERNIAIAPRVEQEWLALNRGYEAARSEFTDVTQRSTQARLSERLEDESKGQRFTLLESARLPVTPIEPNRLSIIFLGVVLALGAGIGIAALVDSLDTTIRSVRDLSELLEAPPIVTIPYMVSAREIGVRRVQKRSALVAAALATVLFVWSMF